MRKGFTLIEVLISIAIIAIIGGFVISSYVGTMKAAKDLYVREHSKLLLLDYMHYCNNKNIPLSIDGNKIVQERHTNLKNDGTNSRFLTMFGPLDTTITPIVQKWENNAYIPVDILSTTRSGVITLDGKHDAIEVSYSITGWDYIKENRFNTGAIILSFIRPKLDSIASTEAIDVPLNTIQFNAENSIMQCSTNINETLNIYYQVPAGVSLQIIRPATDNVSFNQNEILFNKSVNNHYFLVNYLSTNNVILSEIIQAVNNKITTKSNILKLNSVKSLSIEGIAQWKTEKYTRTINYLMIIE